MAKTMERTLLEVNQDNVAAYFFWVAVLMVFLVTIWIFGIGLIVAPLYGITFGRSLARRQAEGLHYWLEGPNLKMEEGVFFLNRKSIPLDRITDFRLYQNPLQRSCGVWELNIQTAGSGDYSHSEGIVIGLREPEKTRDMLLAKRDEIAKSRNYL